MSNSRAKGLLHKLTVLCVTEQYINISVVQRVCIVFVFLSNPFEITSKTFCGVKHEIIMCLFETPQ